MRKKLLGLLSLIFCFAVLLPMPVFADVGPKPSVQLTIEGSIEAPYYVTLLSQKESTGPYYLADKGDPIPDYLAKTDEDRTTWQAFRDYQDADGFYFIEYVQKCDEENVFRWGYYPPQVFKVLIYLPESGEFLTSGINERYAFDSYFTVTASSDGNLTLQKSYDYTWEILSLLARIAATVVLELLVALLFKFRTKKLLFPIAGVNVFTQIVLNLLLNLFNYQSGSWAFVFHYIWMELIIIILEAIVFSIWLQKLENGKSHGKYVAYAVVSNIVSFIFGLFLAKIIPGIF